MANREWKHDPELIKKVMASDKKHAPYQPSLSYMWLVLFIVLLLASFAAFAADISQAKQYFDDAEYGKSLRLYQALEQEYTDQEDVLLGLYANYQSLHDVRASAIKIRLMETERLDSKIALYELDESTLMQLVKNYPSMAVLYHQLALKHADKHQWDEVIRLYEKAIMLSQHKAYHLNLAIAFDKNQQPKNALKHYQTLNLNELNVVSRFEVEQRIKELDDEIRSTPH